MKKSLKKLLSVMLVLALSVSVLSACGKKNEGEDSTPTPTNQQQTSNNNSSSSGSNETQDKEEATPTPEEPAMDLGGMEIIVGDWWSGEPGEPKNQKEEDTLAYRTNFQQKYNFTIKQVGIVGWDGMQELFTTSVMAGDPAAQVMILEQAWTAQPLQNGLLYDLATLKNFDFTEEKWNKNLIDMMTYGNSIYGMAHGKSEPRNGVFWNKRLFQEAGLDPDLPYDLQASGEWTLDKYEEICRALTRDTNNDGTIDTYAFASFSASYNKGAMTIFNSRYIGRDANGKFTNDTLKPEYLEAVQWAISLIEKGYQMPQPEGSNWDWFYPAFHDSKTAMIWDEQYRVGTWADMTDDWGFVLMPKKDANSPWRVTFKDNVVVIPGSYDAETAEKIAFAYNLFTNPTPGYEDDTDAWKEDYYPKFRDERAVDETLALMFDPNTEVVQEFQPFVYGTDPGPDFLWDVYALAVTPAEKLESMTAKWETLLADANK
jgi:hypothetical protein